MRESIKDIGRLKHIIEAIDNVFEFTRTETFETFDKNKILQFAVIKNIEIVGEASYLLTKEIRENNSQIDWKEIINMRHVLVNGYYKINNKIIWQTIQSDLSPLKVKIEKIISNIDSSI